ASTSRRRRHRRLRGQDLGDLWPGELDRQALTVGEQLPHARAAEREARVGRVRAGPGRGHGAAGGAVEGVLEADDLYPELARLVAVEEQLRVVGAVVAADPGVVPPHDEVGAAEVAPDDGVEDRLARAGVAHPGRV